MEGTGKEIVQGLDADDDRSEGGGNLRVTHVADVCDTSYDEIVNLGVKGGLDLGCSAAETDRHAIFGDFADGESLAGEPIGDGGDVGRGGTEVGAYLIGGEPLMVVGRIGVVLAGDELLKGGLLSRVAAEDQDEVGHGQGRTDGAAIVLRVGGGMRIALERDQVAVVDAVDDANGGRELLCGQDGRPEQGGAANEDDGRNTEGKRAQICHVHSWILSSKTTPQKRKSCPNKRKNVWETAQGKMLSV